MRTAARNIAVVLVAQALLVAGYLALTKDRDRRNAAAALRPAPAPEPLDSPTPSLRYRRADGSSGNVNTHHGKPLLLHFWATWCPPCRKELPEIIDFAKRDGTPVLLVSLDKDWPSVRQFFGGSAPSAVVLADAREVEERFATHLLPVSFLVDAGGTMRWRLQGARDWRNEVIASLVRAPGR